MSVQGANSTTNSTSSEAQDLLNSFDSFFYLQHAVLGASTLLFYDLFLTLSVEIRKIWTHRFSLVALLYYLNRYVPIAGYAIILVFMFSPGIWTPDADASFRCQGFASFLIGMTILNQIIANSMMVIRTYALYERNKAVLAVLVASACFSALSSLGNATQTRGILIVKSDKLKLCMADERNAKALVISWAIALAFDIVVFTLTVFRTTRIIGRQRSFRLNSSLGRVMRRDSLMYFINCGAIDFISIILITVDGGKESRFTQSGANLVIVHVIFVTLTSRLVLNLRTEHERAAQAGFPTSRFASDAARTGAAANAGMSFASRMFANFTMDLGCEEGTMDSDGSYEMSDSVTSHGFRS